MVVGHDHVFDSTGAHLLATDDQRDLDDLSTHPIQLGLECGALGRPRRVRKNRLVHRKWGRIPALHGSFPGQSIDFMMHDRAPRFWVYADGLRRAIIGGGPKRGKGRIGTWPVHGDRRVWQGR